MKKFNLALLCKWIWRYFKESEHLWVRVINSRHGLLSCDQEGIKVDGGTASRGGWWRKILSLIEGDKGKWFWGQIQQVLGNGMKAKFWQGTWTNDENLSNKFPRLFNLCSEKNGLVGKMGWWEEGRWRWDFKWRRPLFDREKESEAELLRYLMGVKLVEGVEDTWKWSGAGTGDYSVKTAYKDLVKENEAATVELDQRARGAINRIWKGNAPFKAKVMAWRLIWDKLPTGKNLVRRMQLGPEESRCKCCERETETAEHLFLNCREILELWNRMIKWVGVSWVAPRKLSDHFLSFGGLIDGKNSRTKLGGLWTCIVWVIWKWRNKVCFEEWKWDVRSMEEEIKRRFWSWCLIKGEASCTSMFSSWSRKPLIELWNNL